MNVCFIGNSHLASFKVGWERREEISATFFGATRTAMGQLKVEDGALRPRTEHLRENLLWTGGKDYIGGEYDAYILVGMGFSFPHLMAIMKGHQPPKYRRGGGRLISQACFEAAMHGVLWNSVAVATIGRVREISSAPIIYFPNPFHTTETVNVNSWWNLDAVEEVYDFYNTELSNLSRLVKVVEQSKETLHGTYTLPHFSKDATILKKGMMLTQNDCSHMNGDFARTCLPDILEALHVEDKRR